MRLQKNLILHIAILLLIGLGINTQAQTERKANFNSPNTNIWMGAYANLRLSEKIFWAGEFHFRTTEYSDTRYVGRVAQIYNRHGISYKVKPKIVLTAGPVLRLNFTPEPGNKEYKKMQVEPRIWHEYLFGMPFERLIIYHRFRIEHRWSKSNKIDDEWIFRNRWRYKFYMAIPLNNKKLVPKTWYIAPDIELIIQSGKTVGGSFLEDVRIFPLVGYISSSNIKYSAGVMWTTGQTLRDPYEFNTRWVARLNIYLSYDLRKMEQRVPEIRIFD